MLKRLDWDSSFFNLKIGQVTLEEELLCELKVNEDFDLIYLIQSKDLDISILGYNNTFKEHKVVFTKELVESKVNNENISDLKVNDNNINQLYELAFESGKQSRFKLDTRFPIGSFEELYKKWIDNSVTSQIADFVLTYEESGKIIGFVTCKINDTAASIGLIAVNENTQGKGIGKKLLNEVEKKCFEKGVKKLNIPTQLTNEQACEFYKKNGYSVKNINTIKHYWKI